jgi:type I restriction enzyme S subunit
MREWKSCKIGDLVTLRQGFAINAKSKHYISKENTSLALLRIADMKSGTREIFMREDIPQNFVARPEDIIYTRTGNVGLVFRNCYGVVHNNCFTVTPNNENELTRDFLFYLLQSKAFFDKANSLARGAAQPDLPHTLFNSIEISYPSLPTQHRIATILSRYDTLIENYQKQIKLLEEAAQRLYKEWFVDLRFPGYENVKVVDGLPEEWERKKVEDLLIKHMNGGWGKDTSTGTNVIEAAVIRGTDIEKVKGGFFNDLPFRFHSEKDIVNKHLEANDIILELSNGNLNNVGRTLLVDTSIITQCGEKVICASFCKFLRPVDHRTSVILSLEFDDMQHGERMKTYKKNGANGINNFDFQGFLKHELLIPPKSFSIKIFERIARSISNHRNQIHLLTEARDRLLPKLMSGEMKVI